MINIIKRMSISALMLLIASPAFAGPPFQTDDPDPVELHHFEAYFFELSDGTREGGTNLEVPSFEMNWGAAPNLQLHLVIPFVTSFAPYGGPITSGAGDTELGAKYRLIKETDTLPEVGIFPFLELPTGNASRGLGVGSTWYRLPIWVQKSWGSWTTYGGGGEVIANGNGYNDYAFAGWLLQRQLSDSLTLGGELFGHGPEGQTAVSTESSLMLDLGGYYSFSKGFQLLFAAGKSVAGQGEIYTYVAFYWTWGKEEPESDRKQSIEAPRVSMLNYSAR